MFSLFKIIELAIQVHKPKQRYCFIIDMNILKLGLSELEKFLA